jgi:hypothetical protein
MRSCERRLCAKCLTPIHVDLAQLWSDELANMADPPGRPDWRQALEVDDAFRRDPQFALDPGCSTEVAICLRCIRRARGE